MIKFDSSSKKQLIDVSQENNVFIEGNLLKLIDCKDDAEFSNYIDSATRKDRLQREKRLEITKQIQTQNRELIKREEENKKLMVDLKIALKNSEDAKKIAEDDLVFLQRKTQNELITRIVNFALWIVGGTGISTTLLYLVAMYTSHDIKILESAWINMFGILLTNSFSIIGTIMGVKYGNQILNK
jgi:hypothetical protein